MKNSTRKKFNTMQTSMAKTYAVDNTRETFTATPTIEQKLVDKVAENADLLSQVNMVFVDDQQGQKVIGSVSGILGKRTNTDENDRETQDPLNLSGQNYHCRKTEFDVHIKYSTLDAWAKFDDFNERFMSYVRKAIALSKVQVGFYGKTAADVTDAQANPMGEDVNAGWLQKLRDYESGSQFLSPGSEGLLMTNDATYRLGNHERADFKNLDDAVHELLQLIDEPHQSDGDLVVILGREMIAVDKSQLYKAQGDKPTEKERIENNAVTRTYGGLPAYTFAKFPPRGILITSLKNLSIYIQSGSVRQKVEDNSKRDRIEHFNSMNIDYVVEDESAAAAIDFEKIEFYAGDNADGDALWA